MAHDRRSGVDMTISLIAAVASNGVIGCDGKIPWRIPEDLRYFRAVTRGQTVVMGRKTFTSIGSFLPGRNNIVVIRDPSWSAEGVTVVPPVEAALDDGGDIVVVGGAEIYASALPRAGLLYIAEVHRNYEGDTYFPDVDRDSRRELSRERHDGAPAFSFVIKGGVK